jgi:hypothetical protein
VVVGAPVAAADEAGVDVPKMFVVLGPQVTMVEGSSAMLVQSAILS